MAEAVTELAQGLLDRIEEASAKDDAPYFLWVHYLDPHFPYTPPEPFTDRFQDDDHWSAEPRIKITDRPRQQMTGIGTEQVLDGRDELDFYIARYDAEIAYTDDQIGLLLEEMEGRGLLEDTLTVFTSDHGESLGEHAYYFDHGRFGFQTCVRVPFIVHYPGVLEPRVDPHPVELLHLAPTILEAAGVELEDGLWMQGETLTPRLRGTAPPPETETDDRRSIPEGLAFSEAGWETHNKWQKIVRDDRFKLVYAQTTPEQRWIGGEGVRFTLYDLEADPNETVNTAEEHPEDLERLQRALGLWDNALRFPVEVDPEGGTCGDGQRSMDDETRELLEALGYL